MTSSPSRRALAMLATPLLALSLAGASTAAASTIPDDSVPGGSTPPGSADTSSDVVVTNEGTGDVRINLNDLPEVAGSVLHSVKTNEGSGEIHMSGAETLDAEVAGTTTVEQTAEVIDVAPDGGFTVVRTVDSYEFVITEGPEELGGFLQDDEELEPMVGIPLLQVYDADRVLLSASPADPSVTLTPDQAAALTEILANGADAARLPDADLGVGARWTAFLQGSKGATAEFELVSIGATDAAVAVVIDGDAATLIDSGSSLQDVAGTVTGSGTMTVDLTNSLGSDTAIELTVDMTGTTGDFTFAMTLDSSVTNVVTAG